jgi:hypothetical protein
MNDRAKALLFDRLVDYLINSSSAMDETVKAMTLDPLRISEVNRLNVQIGTAKCLMTQVIYPYINASNPQISSPLFHRGKSRAQIIDGSLEESMIVRPASHQRYPGNPVTFGDIPPEVVRKAFVHLSPSDLAAIRLVCRGWNPTGQDVMMSRLRIRNKRKEKLICGLHLRRIVGFNTFPIKSLDLDLRKRGYVCAMNIAVYAAPTLSSLKIDFDASLPKCYYALQYILSCCRGILHLQLTGFDVGGDVSGQDEDTLRIIKDGLSRLNRLELIRCRGNILSLVGLSDISNLQSFYYESSVETAQESEGIIVAVAMKYPTLTSIRLEAEFDSSVGLIKVVTCCPDLEMLVYYKNDGDLALSRSDIISLRRLKSLDIACEVEDDADSALASFKSLKSLRVVDWDLSEVLPVIGINLARLEIEDASQEKIDLILKYCVDLQYLAIRGGLAGEGSIDMIKNGLAKLAKLKLNGESIRLGTDWMGIAERETRYVKSLTVSR